MSVAAAEGRLGGAEVRAAARGADRGSQVALVGQGRDDDLVARLGGPLLQEVDERLDEESVGPGGGDPDHADPDAVRGLLRLAVERGGLEVRLPAAGRSGGAT